MTNKKIKANNTHTQATIYLEVIVINGKHIFCKMSSANKRKNT